MSLRQFPNEQDVQTHVDLRPLVRELWSVTQNLQARVEVLEGARRADQVPPTPPPPPPPPAAPAEPSAPAAT